MDDNNYNNAESFDPWRFVEKRESGEEGESVKHQFTNTSAEYLAFGFGKHAWYVYHRKTYSIPVLLVLTLTVDVFSESGDSDYSVLADSLRPMRLRR